MLVSSFNVNKNKAIVNFLMGILFKRSCVEGPRNSRELVFWPLLTRGGFARLLSSACPGLWFHREWRWFHREWLSGTQASPRGRPKIKKSLEVLCSAYLFFFSAFYIIYVNLKDFKKKKPAAGGPIFFQHVSPKLLGSGFQQRGLMFWGLTRENFLVWLQQIS